MRVLPFLTLAITSLFILKPSTAQETLKVAPNVPWLGRPAPLELRKLLPTKVRILKCGVAAFGPQGAMRWVVAWTNRDGKSDHDIKIGLFSQSKSGFKKWSERGLREQDVRLPIKLYWLQPSTLTGPVVKIGSMFGGDYDPVEGSGTLIVFPTGWTSKIIVQSFKAGHLHPNDWFYQFPFVDDKGFLCVKYTQRYTDGESSYTDTNSILEWSGKDWS